MSLINQMLQDLEKRRASSTERGVLPHHVRVLPQARKPALAWWFATGSGAVILVGALVWHMSRPAAVPREPVPIAHPQTPASPSAGPVVAPAPPPAVPAVASSTPVATALVQIPTSAVIAAEPRLPPKPAEPIREEADNARKAARPAVEPMQPARTAREFGPAPWGAKRAPASRGEEKAQAAPANAQIDKRNQQLTPQQLAENDYRDGANLLHQGRLAEARQKLNLALQHYPGHVAARQGLFGLLIESKKTGEAEQLLQEGLQLNPHQAGFAMALARMQVDRGDIPGAVETLQKTAPAAVGSPDYLAFLAALLQRQSRHVEAVDHYQAALSLAPGSGVWLMGLGISLQALNRTAEARDAFRRARASDALNADLRAFVDQRLKQLQ